MKEPALEAPPTAPVDWANDGSGRPRVLIIGGGLAGLAAAAALAGEGFRVMVVEARQRLGGRASSFTDAASGQLIDTCQHVSMGCCTNLAHFFRTVGIAHLMRRQRTLSFMTPDRKVSRFAADPLPAPFHLARSFLCAHFLSAAEKMQIGRGLVSLRQASEEEDPPFVDWLAAHRQAPRAVSRFWGLVLTSALNESPDRIGLRYARKVFVDGFMVHPEGFRIEVPAVPLGRLYGEECQAWFREQGVEILMGKAVRELRIENRRVAGVGYRDGGQMCPDWVIAAVPFSRLLDLVPGEVAARYPYFAQLGKLMTSPITSVHLWYREPITSLPNVVLVDCVGQWVFNRGQTAPGEHYVQVVVSAARQFQRMGHDAVEEQVAGELADLFPAATTEARIRGRVVTEHAATFSAVPGVDRWRPVQESPLENLLVAGDWTATGWPATMEGAVRSGYLAAEALCRRLRRSRRLVQAELGRG